MARIRAAAEDLLRTKSFDEITTREVAERAEVGVATLFRYIKSKQELLMMVYGDELDHVLDQIAEADASLDASTDNSEMDAAYFVDRILSIYAARCQIYLANPVNAAAYLSIGFDPDAEASPRHLDQGDRTIDLVTSILEAGQQRGVLMQSVDARLVAQNCHATYMHEIERTPVRGFAPDTIWARLEPRLAVQLQPLGTATQVTS